MSTWQVDAVAIAVFVVVAVWRLRCADRRMRWLFDDLEADRFVRAIAEVKPGAVIRRSIAPPPTGVPAAVALAAVADVRKLFVVPGDGR